MELLTVKARASMQRGFTLIELVITIVVIGAIFGLGALTMGRAFESYDLTRKTTNVDWQGRVALERMARELRRIRSATATDLSFPLPLGSIRFIDEDGAAACFIQNGTTLQRGTDGPAAVGCTSNLQTLADNVVAGSLSFAFYTNVGGAPIGVTNVFYVAVTLQVTEGTVTETYRTTVFPRRL